MAILAVPALAAATRAAFDLVTRMCAVGAQRDGAP
jgi:hypothetical protein